MANNSSDTITITLSRDELLVVLSVLSLDYIPGLDAEPQGQRSSDQQRLAHTVAQRSLLARGLLRVKDNDELILHPSVITAVGVCAYSQSALFMFHWPARTEIPLRYFAHINQSHIVAHTRPDEILHSFSILSDKHSLIDQVTQFCDYQHVSTLSASVASVTSDTFSQVRKLSELGKTEAAIKLLYQNNVDMDVARPFVQSWSNSPRVSIFQILTQRSNQAAVKRDFTLIQGERHAWLALSDPSGDDLLNIQSMSVSDLQRLLMEWLG